MLDKLINEYIQANSLLNFPSLPDSISLTLENVQSTFQGPLNQITSSFPIFFPKNPIEKMQEVVSDAETTSAEKLKQFLRMTYEIRNKKKFENDLEEQKLIVMLLLAFMGECNPSREESLKLGLLLNSLQQEFKTNNDFDQNLSAGLFRTVQGQEFYLNIGILSAEDSYVIDVCLLTSAEYEKIIRALLLTNTANIDILTHLCIFYLNTLSLYDENSILSLTQLKQLEAENFSAIYLLLDIISSSYYLELADQIDPSLIEHVKMKLNQINLDACEWNQLVELKAKLDAVFSEKKQSSKEILTRFDSLMIKKLAIQSDKNPDVLEIQACWVNFKRELKQSNDDFIFFVFDTVTNHFLAKLKYDELDVFGGDPSVIPILLRFLLACPVSNQDERFSDIRKFSYEKIWEYLSSSACVAEDFFGLINTALNDAKILNKNLSNFPGYDPVALGEVLFLNAPMPSLDEEKMDVEAKQAYSEFYQNLVKSFHFSKEILKLIKPWLHDTKDNDIHPLDRGVPNSDDINRRPVSVPFEQQLNQKEADLKVIPSNKNTPLFAAYIEKFVVSPSFVKANFSSEEKQNLLNIARCEIAELTEYLPPPDEQIRNLLGVLYSMRSALSKTFSFLPENISFTSDKTTQEEQIKNLIAGLILIFSAHYPEQNIKIDASLWTDEEKNGSEKRPTKEALYLYLTRLCRHFSFTGDEFEGPLCQLMLDFENKQNSDVEFNPVDSFNTNVCLNKYGLSNLSQAFAIFDSAIEKKPERIPNKKVIFFILPYLINLFQDDTCKEDFQKMVNILYNDLIGNNFFENTQDKKLFQINSINYLLKVRLKCYEERVYKEPEKLPYISKIKNYFKKETLETLKVNFIYDLLYIFEINTKQTFSQSGLDEVSTEIFSYCLHLFNLKKVLPSPHCSAIEQYHKNINIDEPKKIETQAKFKNIFSAFLSDIQNVELKPERLKLLATFFGEFFNYCFQLQVNKHKESKEGLQATINFFWLTSDILEVIKENSSPILKEKVLLIQEDFFRTFLNFHDLTSYKNFILSIKENLPQEEIYNLIAKNMALFCSLLENNLYFKENVNASIEWIEFLEKYIKKALKAKLHYKAIPLLKKSCQFNLVLMRHYIAEWKEIKSSYGEKHSQAILEMEKNLENVKTWLIELEQNSEFEPSSSAEIFKKVKEVLKNFEKLRDSLAVISPNEKCQEVAKASSLPGQFFLDYAESRYSSEAEIKNLIDKIKSKINTHGKNDSKSIFYLLLTDLFALKKEEESGFLNKLIKEISDSLKSNVTSSVEGLITELVLIFLVCYPSECKNLSEKILAYPSTPSKNSQQDFTAKLFLLIVNYESNSNQKNSHDLDNQSLIFSSLKNNYHLLQAITKSEVTSSLNEKLLIDILNNFAKSFKEKEKATSEMEKKVFANNVKYLYLFDAKDFSLSNETKQSIKALRELALTERLKSHNLQNQTIPSVKKVAEFVMEANRKEIEYYGNQIIEPEFSEEKHFKIRALIHELKCFYVAEMQYVESEEPFAKKLLKIGCEQLSLSKLSVKNRYDVPYARLLFDAVFSLSKTDNINFEEKFAITILDEISKIPSQLLAVQLLLEMKMAAGALNEKGNKHFLDQYENIKIKLRDTYCTVLFKDNTLTVENYLALIGDIESTIENNREKSISKNHKLLFCNFIFETREYVGEKISPEEYLGYVGFLEGLKITHKLPEERKEIEACQIQSQKRFAEKYLQELDLQESELKNLPLFEQKDLSDIKEIISPYFKYDQYTQSLVKNPCLLLKEIESFRKTLTLLKNSMLVLEKAKIEKIGKVKHIKERVSQIKSCFEDFTKNVLRYTCSFKLDLHKISNTLNKHLNINSQITKNFKSPCFTEASDSFLNEITSVQKEMEKLAANCDRAQVNFQSKTNLENQISKFQNALETLPPGKQILKLEKYEKAKTDWYSDAVKIIKDFEENFNRLFDAVAALSKAVEIKSRDIQKNIQKTKENYNQIRTEEEALEQQKQKLTHQVALLESEVQREESHFSTLTTQLEKVKDKIELLKMECSAGEQNQKNNKTQILILTRTLKLSVDSKIGALQTEIANNTKEIDSIAYFLPVWEFFNFFGIFETNIAKRKALQAAQISRNNQLGDLQAASAWLVTPIQLSANSPHKTQKYVISATLPNDISDEFAKLNKFLTESDECVDELSEINNHLALQQQIKLHLKEGLKPFQEKKENLENMNAQLIVLESKIAKSQENYSRLPSEEKNLLNQHNKLIEFSKILKCLDEIILPFKTPVLRPFSGNTSSTTAKTENRANQYWQPSPTSHQGEATAASTVLHPSLFGAPKKADSSIIIPEAINMPLPFPGNNERKDVEEAKNRANQPPQPSPTSQTARPAVETNNPAQSVVFVKTRQEENSHISRPGEQPNFLKNLGVST